MISFRKHLDEKLKATDKMGDWVKDFQDSDAPQFKGKSKEKRRQMAVAAKLGAERDAGMREEVELKEQKMTFQDAEKLKSKHLAAMQHHKKSGNSKGYAAHSMVVDKFEDAYDRHGTGVIPVGRIMSASQKAFKDHPHPNVKEDVELDEAVEVSHDRYMRSHGKKASGGEGMWMFTHKRMGDANVNDPKEVHSARGKFSDAKKSAQQWAKKHGHSTVYVMEEVEQIDEISDEKKKEYIRAVADKGGIFRKPRPGSLAGFDRRKEKALVKAFKGGSMQDYVKLHKKSEKRAGIAHKALDSLKKEEVELDEVSDKKLDAYRQKAFADQPSGDDGSDKYRKRKFGRDLAFAKQTGRAKVLATKEEVELDEVSTEKLRDYASAALQDKNKAKADKRWKYAGKAMDKVADREVKAAHSRKYNKMEEVELDEKAYVSSLSPELGRKGSHDVIGKDGKVVKSYPYTKQGMKLAQKHLSKMKEEVELDEQAQYDLVEAYLLENNIDIDSLTEEELNELIGKVIGGAFKAGAKAVVGAGRLAKKAANRMSTAGRAAAAEKRADAAEKRNKDRERIEKARQRLRDAQKAAREAKSGATT